MSDWQLIRELKGLTYFDRKLAIQAKAKQETVIGEANLRKACESHKYVIFVTHVPPFPEATWHEGQQSNNDWLPIMCNVTMGDMLLAMAHEFPDVQILVLCGHTHSQGTYKAASNLIVLTGQSDYRYPQISRELEVPGEFELLF